MPGSQDTNRFVILVRHASREHCWGEAEAEHKTKNRILGSDFTISDYETEGVPRTYALAGRVCDELHTMNITVERIFCGHHEVTKHTAKIYNRVLNQRFGFQGTPQPVCWLDPNKFNGAVHRNNGIPSQPGTARILVGHQPDLTEIARELLGRRYLIIRALPSGQLPIGSSEAALLQLGEKQRLRWLMTKKPTPLLNELKDKIKSKYDVAKFFLGAFVVNTGLLLNAGIWSREGRRAGSPLSIKCS